MQRVLRPFVWIRVADALALEPCGAQHPLLCLGEIRGRSGSYLLCLLVVQPLRDCPKLGLVAHAFNPHSGGRDKICEASLVCNRVSSRTVRAM